MQVYPVNPELYPFGVKPEPGYIYGYVHGACDACTEAGAIQPGHFACHLTPIPEGWEAVTAPILTDSGWVVLVRRPQTLPGGVPGQGASGKEGR